MNTTLFELEEILLQETEKLKLVSDKLNENTRMLMIKEQEMTLLRAKLISQEGIVNLPNQVMRDAKIEETLLNDPLYSEDYRTYLIFKMENKIAYNEWVLQQELVKTFRVLVMKGRSYENL